MVPKAIRLSGIRRCGSHPTDAADSRPACCAMTSAWPGKPARTATVHGTGSAAATRSAPLTPRIIPTREPNQIAATRRMSLGQPDVSPLLEGPFRSASDERLSRSDVEAEVKHVALAHETFLALEPKLAGIAGTRLALAGDEIVVGDGLGADAFGNPVLACIFLTRRQRTGRSARGRGRNPREPFRRHVTGSGR